DQPRLTVEVRPLIGPHRRTEAVRIAVAEHPPITVVAAVLLPLMVVGAGAGLAAATAVVADMPLPAATEDIAN
ncbi:MAG TPA: hypothetical protein VLL05_11160, partial [Terriglobales bacterium]|nr:hypothetical protein [Terriglobales bacterium]